MASVLEGYYDVGTVSIENGSDQLIGAGTFWLATGERFDEVYVAGQRALVKSIDADGIATLAMPWDQPNVVDAPYVWSFRSQLRIDATDLQAKLRDLIAFYRMGGVRGTREVTTAADAIVVDDLNKAIVYNRATAIAATIAEAGANNMFVEGWATYVRNIGVGAVTITPATSTINGSATLVLGQGVGAFIWSHDGKYQAFVFANSDMRGANNLSDVANKLTAATNLKAVSYGGAQALTSTERVTARSNIYAAPFDALAYNGMQVNGSMEVSQENGTSAIAVATGTVNKYLIDGWSISKSGTSVGNFQQVASVFPGYNNALKYTCTTAQPSIPSDYGVIRNLIEGYRAAKAGWGTAAAQPITIGFWVKSSVAGSLPVSLINSDFSSTVAASVTPTIAAANTAQFITASFPAQTGGTWNKTNGIGFQLQISIAAGGAINIFSTIGNTFEITGLIILPGLELPSSDRAPLIMRPYDEDLRMCQRYLQRFSAANINDSPAAGVVYSATQALYPLLFRQKMRASPSFVATPADWQCLIAATASTVSSFTGSTASPDMAQINCVVSGLTAGQGTIMRALSTSAFLQFDARL